MEARGNLMLAVLARTLRNYFLLQDGNANQPGSVSLFLPLALISERCTDVS